MKENKGISLVPLIILIIIMLILLGISAKVSRDILEKSKAEKLLVYMQLIEARASAYYEEIDFEIGEKSLESYLMDIGEEIIKPDKELLKMEPKLDYYDMQDYCIFIKWDKEKLKEQGIDNSFLEKDDEYFVVSYLIKEDSYHFDANGQYVGNMKYFVKDVYYSKGIYLNENKNEDGSKKLIYSMSDLKQEINR